MKIGIVAPSPVPFAIGGAEKLWWGLQREINQGTQHRAELIKLPSPERDFDEIIASYRRFAGLDVSHFDQVISTKYPAWMVEHPNHVCYLQHRLRGLYDTYGTTQSGPLYAAGGDTRIQSLRTLMTRHAGERAALPEFFARLDALREADDLPPEATVFPGPWIRELVHWMDGVALSRTAITRFVAISKNVAQRENYFPSGSSVEVVHHPSDLTGLHRGTGEHLLTVCRLDGAKRVSLMIDAMRRVEADIPFKIAGTGPEADELKARAAGDPRIELLGFVDDRELEALYAGARAVLYTPYDEDYGLVPFEAMTCGVPVVTTRDSGGPLELIVDGVTGVVAEASADALAHAIDALLREPARARALGLAGRERVREIEWPRVVSTLMDEGGRSLSPSLVPNRRRITVATTFPFDPPEGGGQLRIFHLYRELAREFDVEVVCLGQVDSPRTSRQVAPGLREICVPKSASHAKREAALSKKLDWLPITDVAMPQLYRESPAYLEALRNSAAEADVVVACHPYVVPALQEVSDAPLWYEAQDVEWDLKRSVLPDSEPGRDLLERTREVERECCEQADLILTCSAEDATRLSELYGGADARGSRTVVVPNGFDPATTAYVSAPERRRRQTNLGLGQRPTALFMGSWHVPNVEAARAILEWAPRLPEINFLIVGSVGGSFADVVAPGNVALMGVVDDETKGLVLGIADVALNPMISGTGTNLKMLEYCAAGIPTLTTQHGLRGLALGAKAHVEVAEIADFEVALRNITDPSQRDELAERSERARRQVEAHYDWQRIAGDFIRELAELE